MDKIIICTKCLGTGRLCRNIGGHKSDYRVDECCECEGSGRLKETTTVQYRPFKSGKESTRIF